MRISGRRADGALHLSIGAGMAVILRGDTITPPMDEIAVMKMGPWEDVAFDATERKEVLARADRARVEPVT